MEYTSYEKIFDKLQESLSLQSKWFLVTLITENRDLHKEELRNLANDAYKKKVTGSGSDDLLVPSRYNLDLHTARLEGAGLVNVKEVGRVRIYSVSTLGIEFFKYATQKE